MRKFTRMILIVVCLFVLTSCNLSRPDPPDVKIGFKNDTSGDLGMAAAVYGDRIYYTSNELGKAGICSMKPDGSDVRQEIVNPSIMMLQLFQGKLYFCGLNTIEQTTATPIQAHHALFAKNIDGSTKYKDLDPEHGDNKVGVYVNDDLLLVYWNDGGQGIKLLKGEKLKPKTIKVSFKYKKITVENKFYIQGNTLATYYPATYQNEDKPYIVDMGTGNLVLKCDTTEGTKAFCMDDENLYCSYNEMVVVFNRSDYSVKARIIPGGLTSDYTIENISRFGGDLYILADRWTDEGSSLLSEKLYHADAKTLSCSEVLSLDKNQRVLGMTERMILLDGGKIYKAALKGGSIGEKTKLIDAPGDISSRNYMVDYAGDWMFLYKVYPETGSPVYGDSPGQQLLYKINLKSGEVVQNDVKLDFSILKSYEK